MYIFACQDTAIILLFFLSPSPSSSINSLKQSASTLSGTTVAVFYLASHTAHVVAVVPGQLCACLDVVDGEECDPGEAQVMGVNEDILHKHIGLTRVLRMQRKGYCVRNAVALI